MKEIQIFDPALCCSSGVCGTDADQQLVDFSATARWAQQQGLPVARHNLAQEPMRFAENPVVRDFLAEHGEAGLPLVLVDGKQVLSGRYPDRAELARFAGAEGAAATATVEPSVADCCSTSEQPSGCC
jgi:hypothetical protein